MRLPRRFAPRNDGQRSISTVGHINYYLLLMIDYCKRGRDGRRFLYMIKDY